MPLLTGDIMMMWVLGSLFVKPRWLQEANNVRYDLGSEDYADQGRRNKVS